MERHQARGHKWEAETMEDVEAQDQPHPDAAAVRPRLEVVVEVRGHVEDQEQPHHQQQRRRVGREEQRPDVAVQPPAELLDEINAELMK